MLLAKLRCCVQVWLKQPLVKVDEIQTRHDIVDAFVNDPHLRQSLRDEHFRGAPTVQLPLHACHLLP